MAKIVRFARQTAFLLLSCLLFVLGQVTTTAIASAHTSTPMAARSQQSAVAPCLQPPQNVNLITLSDAQLQLYGLPNHATFNENPRLWTRILAHAKYHSCTPAVDGNRGPSVKRAIPHTVGCTQPGEMCPNPNWAGNEAVGSRGTYKEADTEFYVPSISTSVVGSRVSLWAGVGGDPNFAGNSWVLVQAGVDAFVDSNHHQINQSWWEVVPGYSEQHLPFSKGLHVGDDIAVIVHSNSYSYPNQDAFFLDNFTTNEYINKISSSLALSDSASAEWIVERVTVGCCLAPLAQFQNSGQPPNTVRLYGNEAEKNGSSQTYSVASLSHLYNQIYVDPNNLNTLMASVGPIDQNGYDYSVTWHRGS